MQISSEQRKPFSQTCNSLILGIRKLIRPNFGAIDSSRLPLLSFIRLSASFSSRKKKILAAAEEEQDRKTRLFTYASGRSRTYTQYETRRVMRDTRGGRVSKRILSLRNIKGDSSRFSNEISSSPKRDLGL